MTQINQYTPIIYYVIVEIDDMDLMQEIEIIQSQDKALVNLSCIKDLNPDKTFRLLKLTEEVIA